MAEERNISDLQLYGAEDFEELDSILDALDKATASDDEDKSARSKRQAGSLSYEGPLL